MRYLLDTHALLWALGDPRVVCRPARDVLASAANIIFVSSASLWECAIKASIGKLELPDHVFDAIPETGYEVLPIRLSYLNAYRALPLQHRDPFDRMFVAQARAEFLILITRDPEIAKYDVALLRC